MKCAPEIHFPEPLRNVRLIDRTHLECERSAQERERAAYERGLRDGEKSLGQQLITQRSELLALQNGVFDSLTDAVPQVVSECEAALIDLALEVARKLVSEMPISAEMVQAAIREALDSVKDSAQCLVLLNPADLELLQQINSPQSLVANAKNIECCADASVPRGGCIVRTQFGSIDARRETKLDLLRKSIHMA